MMAEGGIQKSPVPKNDVLLKSKDTTRPVLKDNLLLKSKDTKPPVPKDSAPVVEELSGKFSIRDINSLEFLLARDLIAYVMNRRIPYWDFESRFACTSPVTPFSFKIRNAIEHFLMKEDINIFALFGKGFPKKSLTYHEFIRATSYIVDSVFPSVQSPYDMLRLLALIAQFTSLAYRKGIHMAPYYSLIEIQDLLCRYIEGRKLDPIDFYLNLGIYAVKLIKETPLVLGEDLL